MQINMLETDRHQHWSFIILLWSIVILLRSTHAAEAYFETFEACESTVQSVHEALFLNSASCRDIVSSFIARIEAFNPTINAILSLNPAALTIADELDQRLLTGNNTGRLFCIPILLKDNFDAIPMYTTGSSLALAAKRPLTDGPVVQALRNEGAVILGKTTLHEMALEGISVSSLGGQPINPYDHTRTPGGSSGGTGAAIAASFAVFGTGTDTMNSLRSPASANSLVSLRPTRGLISRSGVMPVSHTQDTVGPIARTIDDLAIALTVMAGIGIDESDNATIPVPVEERYKDYSSQIREGKLSGMRIGVLDGFWNHASSAETSPVNNAMDSMIDFLRAQGVEIFNITETVYNATRIGTELDVQKYEFRELLDKYLGSPNIAGNGPRNFRELYESKEFVVLPYQYEFIHQSLYASTSNASYAKAIDGIEALTKTLRKTFSDNQLDAIIYPEQKNLVVKLGSPSQSGRNGILAALTGHPVVAIPTGYSASTEDAPLGVPIGMEILGLPFSEEKLLQIAWQIEHMRPLRKAPNFVTDFVETPGYNDVPTILPNQNNILQAYPIGVLS